MSGGALSEDVGFVDDYPYPHPRPNRFPEEKHGISKKTILFSRNLFKSFWEIARVRTSLSPERDENLESPLRLFLNVNTF